jgi:O-acetyl-ADP-ribose deacetylase (regulator of RNase III)/predicted RNA-binding Zn-ribbon protein involved in translation (DUF1610 family)
VVQFTFEASACPECGSALLTECNRCGEPILFPAEGHCEFCGVPQPWAPERLATPRRTRGRSWTDTPRDGRIGAKQVNIGGRGTLWLIEGDVTEFAVGAVISDDDVEGRMWTQVASAIKRAAGEDVEYRSMRKRPYALGDAWKTESGGLEDVQTIIHVALMDRRGNTKIEHVERCIENAFAIAARDGLESVALATIGTGSHGVDPDEWLTCVARVVVDFLYRQEAAAAAPLAILVVLYEPESFRETFHRFEEAALTAADARRTRGWLTRVVSRSW